uniref:Ovule protein n=1 Tax=Heterorhabditis bacteriophora TaxID=37862 RepID=A0A1I7WK66_HETBA
MALQKDLGNSVVLQSENREDRLHLNYSPPRSVSHTQDCFYRKTHALQISTKLKQNTLTFFIEMALKRLCHNFQIAVLMHCCHSQYSSLNLKF